MSSMTGNKGYGGGNGMTGSVPKGYTGGQLQNFTPQQTQLFNKLFNRVGQGSFMAKLANGNQGQFDAIEAPAFRALGDIQSSIANRYSGTGQGEMSSRKSSGFYNEQNAQGQKLAEALQGNRFNLQRQAIKDLFDMSNELLEQRPFSNYLSQNPQKQKKKKQSTWDSILSGIFPIGGAAIGGLIGGPAGAAAGGSIGSAAGNAYYGN